MFRVAGDINNPGSYDWLFRHQFWQQIAPFLIAKKRKVFPECFLKIKVILCSTDHSRWLFRVLISNKDDMRMANHWIAGLIEMCRPQAQAIRYLSSHFSCNHRHHC